MHRKIEKIIKYHKRREMLAPKARIGIRKQDFQRALLAKPYSLIAELKPASPSGGKLGKFDAAASAKIFEKAGADAISILTEPTAFGGNLENITLAKMNSRLPVLCKDFIVTEKQIREADAFGADAVLLIPKIIGEDLGHFAGMAADLGMQPLVECFSKAEIEAAGKISDVIGINNRSFDDLSVDISRTKRLAKYVPEGKILVSESGILSCKEIRELLPFGARSFLVGTSIMQSQNMAGKIRELKGCEL
ncbi:MAG: indole-3-glycerol-phosphate synthase [Candidatus Micrarchaeota archaeon]